MRNPFRPGNGLEPPFFAGRDKYINDFTKSLEIAKEMPRNLVLFGLRGTGKTVLLRIFKEISYDNNWVFVEREFNERFCDENKFAEAVARDVITKVAGLSLIKKAKQVGKRVIDLLKPKELSAYGISYRPFYGKKKELLEDYIIELLVENWGVFKKSKKSGLVFLYDEFHTVIDKQRPNHFPLASFLGALSYAQREGCRYYVVFSGLPNVAINLKKAKTYVERMFTFRNISNLSKDNSILALKKPLELTDYSFDKNVINKIVDETQGYPYFIQFYGFFLLENLMKKKISMGDYEKIHPLLIDELDNSFFEDRFERASDNEKEVLFTIAKIGEKDVKTSEILANIDLDVSLLMEFLKRLNNKGLIFRPKKGQYSFTLPIFRDFLLRKLNTNKH